MRTRWAEAFAAAVEGGPFDAARLARGRAYAVGGHVGEVRVRAGRAVAQVRGAAHRPYRAELRVPVCGDAAWQRFLDAAAAEPGYAAALLAGDPVPAPPDAEAELLPAAGDLRFSCTCPDPRRPCKHAAALGFALAAQVDADPLVLPALRGRDPEGIGDELRRRIAVAGAAPRPRAEAPSIAAAEALRRPVAALPEPIAVPAEPGRPPAVPPLPGAADPLALDTLGEQAAARAFALLVSGEDAWGGLTEWQDAARLAARQSGAGLTSASRALYAGLAAGTGRTVADLARAAAAWRQGGAEGLAVLEEPWDPPAGGFDRARSALAAGGEVLLRPERNRLTDPGGAYQLRLGRDGRWYPYESAPADGAWWPRGAAHQDPFEARDELREP